MALCAVVLLGACGALPAATLEAGRPPKEALPLDASVRNLALALFVNADLDPSVPRTLVVDPLIDRATGNQAAVTRAMEARVTALIPRHFPQIEPRPFTPEALDLRPLVLVGSVTGVAGPGVVPPLREGRPATYRIWAALADLRTGKVVAQQTAWVRGDGVDMTPTAFFQDSPAWAADPAMAAYLKTCGTRPGEAIDPAYLTGLRAASLFAQGTKAYEARRYDEALTYYAQARLLPAGDQVRILNGLYLGNQALGRARAAEEAFGQLVDAGLGRDKLAVKFVFRPASTEFWPDPGISGPYPMWLRQIAQRTAARGGCLRLVGHTSPTGSPRINDALSERRARSVQARLVDRAPSLADRTEARGVGSRETVVGNGKDDLTDVLDRRVEFEPRRCETLRADAGAVTRAN